MFARYEEIKSKGSPLIPIELIFVLKQCGLLYQKLFTNQEKFHK